MDKTLEKRLDRIEWVFLSLLEREIFELLCKLLTYPDGAVVVAQILAEVRARVDCGRGEE